jgi:predicted small lipoprotein YifL
MAALAGCGQKGALLLPTETAARNRATLTQTLRPAWAKPRTAPAGTPPPADAAGIAPAAAAAAPALVSPTLLDQVPESTLQE